YLIDPNYDWVEICEHQFGNHPVQVCLPWNTVAHKAQYEGSGKRRPLTFDEVETLFDTADAKVEELASSGKKGALAALRDSQIFKTAYAFGLRRNELAQLDLADLHYNSEAKHWGRYAAVHVRWGESRRRRRASTSHRLACSRIRLVGTRYEAVGRGSPQPV